MWEGKQTIPLLHSLLTKCKRWNRTKCNKGIAHFSLRVTLKLLLQRKQRRSLSSLSYRKVLLRHLIKQLSQHEGAAPQNQKQIAGKLQDGSQPIEVHLNRRKAAFHVFNTMRQWGAVSSALLNKAQYYMPAHSGRKQRERATGNDKMIVLVYVLVSDAQISNTWDRLWFITDSIIHEAF